MKIRILIAVKSLLFLFAIVATNAYASNACVQLCQEKNRTNVKICNYPKKESQELRQCLATAKNNFDACMQACGK